MDLAKAKAAVKKYKDYTNWKTDLNQSYEDRGKQCRVTEELLEKDTFGPAWRFITICTVLDDISTRLEALENVGK